MTNLSHSCHQSGKCIRDWHDLRECVKLTSTRWINTIIAQTWKGENPFKARKAKQGPWLIHLANLRVMYECQGTLVRQGDRRVCVYSVDMVSVYFFKGWWGGGASREDALWMQSSLLEMHSFFSLSTPLGISVNKANGALEPGCGNDKKMHWVSRVGGKRDCFANEVRKRGCGLLGSRVSTRMLCHTKSSIRSCQHFPTIPHKLNDCFFSKQQV